MSKSVYEDARGILVDVLISDDPDGALDRHQKRGQTTMVEHVRLPKKTGGGYDETPEEAKARYKKVGIKVIEDYDDMFFNVELPSGWRLEPDDNPLWTYVIDEKGRTRIEVFHKDAFWDRDAFSRFVCRYSTKLISEYENRKWDLTYEERRDGWWFGIIRDQDKEIFRTEGSHRLSHWSSKDTLLAQETQRDLVIDKINELFPDWQDPFAYWD